MAQGVETVLRFEEVSFQYGPKKPILDEVNFAIRKGSKITLMGQNGAGKSSLFSLITKDKKPEEGEVHTPKGATIALARQIIPQNELDLTVREFFQKCFKHKVYDIDPKIDEVLDIVELKGHEKVHERIMRSFSGGQQARLLLASALIQNPDILLLDEPTNNLDKAGIEHLTQFLKNYTNTVIVISHDAEFLNSFTEGVLYLDIYTKKIEYYVGNYFDVTEQIKARVEKENKKNAQLGKSIQAKKDKANEFAHKGGRLRAVAKRMRELAEELEEDMVDVRREDKTIKNFIIPSQPEYTGTIAEFKEITLLKKFKPIQKKLELKLKRNTHILLKGPNGIGKTTLLESLAKGTALGAHIEKGVRVGYYRQDFSTLNFEDSVFDSLKQVMPILDEHKMRSVAASFLITGELIHAKIGTLSEGQKGLVAFARLVLQAPGLLILDEPTNHINFRHLPVIAKALDSYDGAMILVSHVPEFVEKIRIDEIIDLEKLHSK